MDMNMLILWASFLVGVVFVWVVVAYFRRFCEICAKHYFYCDFKDATEEIAATSTERHDGEGDESTLQKAEVRSAGPTDNEPASQPPAMDDTNN